MILGDAFREALANARGRCGAIITLAVEAMGYRIVPGYLVKFFEQLLDAEDKKRAQEPCHETDSHGVPCEMKGPHATHACPEALARRYGRREDPNPEGTARLDASLRALTEREP